MPTVSIRNVPKDVIDRLNDLSPVSRETWLREVLIALSKLPIAAEITPGYGIAATGCRPGARVEIVEVRPSLVALAIGLTATEQAAVERAKGQAAIKRWNEAKATLDEVGMNPEWREL
jgi:hypothetical protein